MGSLFLIALGGVGLLSAVCGSGCVPRELDIGSEEGGTAARATEAAQDASRGLVRDAGSSPGRGPVPDAIEGGNALRTQTWNGTLVDLPPSLGESKAISMTLRFAADETVTGTFLFGGWPVLDPPSDPNANYPALIDSLPVPFLTSSIVPFPYLQHFPFTIRNGTLQGSRLRFELDILELWAQWCAIQTMVYALGPDGAVPVPTPDGGAPATPATLCVPGGVRPNYSLDARSDLLRDLACGLWDPDGGVWIPLDCGRLGLCKACKCTTNGCVEISPDASVGFSSPVNTPLFFDVQIIGRTANGSVAGLTSVDAIVMVHFDESP
jgi:hypothetical protein